MRAVPQGDCKSDAQLEAQRCDLVADVTLRALDCPEGCHRWEWQVFGVAGSFFTTDIAASLESLRHQKAVCCNAQGRVMVKAPPAPPASPFILTQSQILFQILVIALKAPAPMRGANQVVYAVSSGNVDT